MSYSIVNIKSNDPVLGMCEESTHKDLRQELRSGLGEGKQLIRSGPSLTCRSPRHEAAPNGGRLQSQVTVLHGYFLGSKLSSWYSSQFSGGCFTSHKVVLLCIFFR